jgi:ABC-type multidrug transport system fused ATPase/permease subunit
MEMYKYLKRIQNVISKDPLSRNYFSFGVFIFFICGLVLAITATVIESAFFSSVFNLKNFLLAIVCISFINLLKITSHFLTKYVSRDEKFKSSRGMFYFFRGVLILFSIMACFSKVAEYMNNPHLQTELQKATADLQSQYNNEFNFLDKYVRNAADSLERESKNQRRGVVKGPKWNADSSRVAMYQFQLKDLNNDFFHRKKIIEDSVKLTDDVKNQTFVSVVDLIQKLGFDPNKNKAYALYVLSIAVLFTLILEIGMWFVFEYLGILYYRRISSKLSTHEEISEEIEKVKRKGLKDDLSTYEDFEEIGRSADKATNGLSIFNDSLQSKL